MVKFGIVPFRNWCLCLSLLTAGVANAAEAIRVGLLLDKGGKDDKSFNAAAVVGAGEAERELGIRTKVVEMPDDNANEGLLRKFARDKYDLIIAVGFAQMDAVRKVGKDFPDRKFLLIDAEVSGANVRSAMFEEHQGSFLAGALAAMKSKTGRIGFIGGMDIPLIRRFQKGYEAGARHVNAKIQTSVNFVGVTSEAWINPPKAKELALTQFAGGADVIFAAAGRSTMGLFDAAEEKKKLAIGVDSNQNWVKPGFVLTSMMKRVDLAVLNSIRDLKKGTFKPGTIRYGLPDKGVELAMDKFNAKLVTKDDMAKLGAIQAAIIAGKIKVPDYYVDNAKK